MATPPADEAAAGDLLPIGRAGRAHGIRGAIRINCSAEHAVTLRQRPVLYLGGRPFQVRGVRGTDDSPIVDLDGLDTRTDAEALQGAEAALRREDLGPEREDEYRFADLVGCAVLDEGDEIGEVAKVEHYPANEVLTVRRTDGGADVLVPFIADAVLEVDLDAREIHIDGEFLGVRGAGE